MKYSWMPNKLMDINLNTLDKISKSVITEAAFATLIGKNTKKLLLYT